MEPAMIVRMWMQQDLITIQPDKLAIDAASLMARKSIRRLPVVEQHPEGHRLVGILSARDILHAFPPDINPFAVMVKETNRGLTSVRELMSRNLVTTTPDTPIEHAAALMRERKIGALPVLRDNQLAGLITESDIFRAFVGFFSAPQAGARVTFDISRGEDVFGFVAEIAAKRKVRVVSLICSSQDNGPVCVVRLAGESVDALLDDLWASKHTVLNVVRFG